MQTRTSLTPGARCQAVRTLGTPRPRRPVLLFNIGANNHFGVHDACFDNSVRAVMERVFNVETDGEFHPPFRPFPGAFNHSLRRFRSRLCAKLAKTAPVSTEQFVDCYRGRRRLVYQSAADSLLVTGVEKKDSFLSSFVKAEKINFTAKTDPAPRLIQPRSPRYNVSVGVYIKPIEHDVYNAINGVFGAPVVAKGLNAFQRGLLLRDAWDRMDDPVAVFLDASRFDQHVSEEALRWEHSVYCYAYDNDPTLQRLLSWQLRNKGFIRDPDGDIKYRTIGTRCSGDMNTALGNVLIMCALMWTYLREVAPGSQLVNDGDDCVVLVERRLVDRVKSTYFDWFKSYGFKMKWEGHTDVFEQIEFCQSQPVFDGHRWRMVRDPRISLDKDVLCTRPLDTEKEWRLQMQAMSDCGLALAGDLPVLGAFYNIFDVGETTPRQLETGMDYLARGLEGKRSSPTAEARDSFFAAFGITPDEQVALEQFYDTITPVYSSDRSPRDSILETHNAILSC